MKLPEPLLQQIQAVAGGNIVQVAPVSGGCISNTTRLQFSTGEVALLKWGRTSEHPAALFSEEAHSLRAIAATRTVRVPRVLEQQGQSGFAWLLLEWIWRRTN